jgi:hypothetical protein
MSLFVARCQERTNPEFYSELVRGARQLRVYKQTSATRLAMSVMCLERS